MKKKNVKPLLPIFYDALTSYPFTNNDLDALTYYEILRIIIGKVNEITTFLNGDVPAEAERWFYVPEDFGAVGDGIFDCTQAFNDAALQLQAGEIRILFIPANKTYLIKNTIAIPAGSILLGSGETSRIYYDETFSNFGVGITTGGDDIIISNLRIDHKIKTPILVTGAMTGALSVSNIIHAGEISPPMAQYAYSQMRKNIIISRIWTDGRYSLQTEPKSSTDVIENVFVSDIYNPGGAVSLAPKGSLRNVVYRNINCEMLRTGSVNTMYGKGITVDGFKCNFLRAFSDGVEHINGVIDCSKTKQVPILYNIDDPDDKPFNALDVRPGNKFENVSFIEGDPEITTAVRVVIPSGADETLSFVNCDFGNFRDLWTNYSGIPRADFVNCRGSQTSGHLNVIRGTIYGGNMEGAIQSSRSPITYCSDPKVNSLDFDFQGSVITGFTGIVFFQNSRLYIRQARTLPVDGLLCKVTNENMRKYLGNDKGDVLPVLLVDGSGGVKPVTASFSMEVINDSDTAVLRINADAVLTNYVSYVIDSSILVGAETE